RRLLRGLLSLLAGLALRAGVRALAAAQIATQDQAENHQYREEFLHRSPSFLLERLWTHEHLCRSRDRLPTGRMHSRGNYSPKFCVRRSEEQKGGGLVGPKVGLRAPKWGISGSGGAGNRVP